MCDVVSSQAILGFDQDFGSFPKLGTTPVILQKRRHRECLSPKNGQLLSTLVNGFTTAGAGGSFSGENVSTIQKSCFFWRRMKSLLLVDKNCGFFLATIRGFPSRISSPKNGEFTPYHLSMQHAQDDVNVPSHWEGFYRCQASWTSFPLIKSSQAATKRTL